MSTEQTSKTLPAEQSVAKMNVRSKGATEYAGPLIRTVTKVRFQKQNGHTWLRWEWTPEPRQDGQQDYGYAGLREDADDFEEMKAKLAKEGK